MGTQVTRATSQKLLSPHSSSACPTIPISHRVFNCSDCFSFLLRFFLFFFFYLRVTEDTQSSLWTAGLLGSTTKQPLFWGEAATARVKSRAPTWQSSRCPSAEADLPGKWEEVYRLKHQENSTRSWLPSLQSGSNLKHHHNQTAKRAYPLSSKVSILQMLQQNSLRCIEIGWRSLLRADLCGRFNLHYVLIVVINHTFYLHVCYMTGMTGQTG